MVSPMNMKRRELIRLGAASLLVPASTGCATLWNLFQKYVPQLSIQRFEILGMTLTSIATRFHVNITNPNPIGFKLDGLDYLLRVAGNELAKGEARKGINLQARTGAKTNLDLEFNLGNTAAAILDLIGKNVVPFELQATGKFFAAQTGGQGIDVPVGFKSRLPMPKIPQLNVRAFNPTSVSPSGVGFRIDTAVHNSNDFEIPIDGFNIDLKLDGRNVLENKAVRGLRVAPSKTENVPIDFHVALAALGMTVADLAAGKTMSWELGTDLRSGKLVVPFKHNGKIRLA